MSNSTDINIIKKEVAERLGITLSELEEKLEDIRSEAPGLISDKVALLILLERHGIIDRELVSKITGGYAFLRLVDLSPGMQGITIVGRIIRRIFSSKRNEIAVVIDDGTQRVLVTISGKNRELFRKIGFEPGDIILIKNGKVAKSFGTLIKVLVDDEAEISYLDETDLMMYSLGSIPQIPPPLSIRDVLRSAEEIVREGEEIDVKGYLVWIGNINIFEKSDKKTIKRLILKIADEVDPRAILRVVAWGDIADSIINNVLRGDLILLQGGVLKINEYLSKKTSKQFFELHLGNLSNFKIIGAKRDKIAETSPNKTTFLFAYALTEPVIKTYINSEGKEKSMASLYIGDDTGLARLVIWKNECIEKIKNIESGTRLRVIGTARESKFGKVKSEIHISSPRDDLIINPRYFPKDLLFEKVLEEAKSLGIIKVRPIDMLEVLRDFSEIPLNKRLSVMGYLSEVKKLSKEGGPIGIAKLRDDQENEVTLMLWNNKILEKLIKLPLYTQVIIKGVKTSKEDRGKGPVIFVGDKSLLEVVSEKASKVEVHLKPLSLAEIGKTETIFGTVIDAEFIGNKRFCKICGLPIVSGLEDENACPRGHFSATEELLTLVIIIDDDIKNARVYIKENTVRRFLSKIGVSEEEFLSKEDVLKCLKEKIIGLEIALRGEISGESIDTDFLIMAKDVFEPPAETLINALKYHEGIE